MPAEVEPDRQLQEAVAGSGGDQLFSQLPGQQGIDGRERIGLHPEQMHRQDGPLCHLEPVPFGF